MVLPTNQSVFDPKNGGVADVVTFAQRSICFLGLRDYLAKFRGKAKMSVASAGNVLLPAANGAIELIVRMRPPVQMVGIDAQRVVALVAGNFPIAPGPHRQVQCYMRGGVRNPANFEFTIEHSGLPGGSSTPNPAVRGVGLLTFREKTLRVLLGYAREVFGGMRHMLGSQAMYREFSLCQ